MENKPLRRCRCQTNARNTKNPTQRSVWYWQIVALTTVLLINVATATPMTSSSDNFVKDGATTYCWEVDTSIYSNKVDRSTANLVSAQGDDCPLSLSIAFPSDDVYANDSVSISWNATQRFASGGVIGTNLFGVTEFVAGLDRISQNHYQIIASRLRTCTTGEDCNPVTTGSQLTENTTNIPLNFTDGLAAFETSELSFDQPGGYILLAHLILPSSTPTLKRYDYAVFLDIKISSKAGSSAAADTTATPYAKATEDSKSTGLSTEVICVLIISGIVVLALIVIGFVTLRSRINRNPEANASKCNNPKKAGGMFGFASTGIKSVGDVAVVSDEEAEEFAMLSMHEASICQQRESTYLSASNRGRHDPALTKKKASPIQFAGPMCNQSLDQKEMNPAIKDSTARDITPQIASVETPGNSQGNYVNLDNTPKALAHKPSPYDQNSAQPGQILFNDIMEDEVDSSGRKSGVAGVKRRPNFEDSTMSTLTDLNLTAVSNRIKQHRDNAEQVAAAHKQDELTADDLRDSETKGPMALSDLLLSRVR